MQRVPVVNQAGVKGTSIQFFDPGATISLCRHKWARHNNIEGTPVTIYIKVVGKQYEELKSLKYVFWLEDVRETFTEYRLWESIQSLRALGRWICPSLRKFSHTSISTMWLGQRGRWMFF